jgi:hypothetical protein
MDRWNIPVGDPAVETRMLAAAAVRAYVFLAKNRDHLGEGGMRVLEDLERAIQADYLSDLRRPEKDN